MRTNRRNSYGRLGEELKDNCIILNPCGEITTTSTSTTPIPLKKSFDPAIELWLKQMTHRDVYCQIFCLSAGAPYGFVTKAEASRLSCMYKTKIESTIVTFYESLRVAQHPNVNVGVPVNKQLLPLSNLSKQDENMFVNFLWEVFQKNKKYFVSWCKKNNISSSSPIFALITSTRSGFPLILETSICDSKNLNFYFLSFYMLWHHMYEKLIKKDPTLCLTEKDFEEPVFCKFHGILGQYIDGIPIPVRLLFENSDGKFFFITQDYYTKNNTNSIIVGPDTCSSLGIFFSFDFSESFCGQPKNKWSTQNIQIPPDGKFVLNVSKGDCLLVHFKKTVPKLNTKTSLFKLMDYPYIIDDLHTKKPFTKDKTGLTHVKVEPNSWYIEENFGSK